MKARYTLVQSLFESCLTDEISGNLKAAGFSLASGMLAIAQVSLCGASTFGLLETQPWRNPPAVLAATESDPPVPDFSADPQPFPSFDSLRLDQQLAVYETYLAEFGPPDILIVGSSRSLQGVDPIVLQQALVQQGYPEFKIFNFSVNGATAQVVNLVLQDILTPEQLPRMVIWAGGARAFNAGRPDLTYDSIKASAGYQQLQTGNRPIEQSAAKQSRQSPVTVTLSSPSLERCQDLPPEEESHAQTNATNPAEDDVAAAQQSNVVGQLQNLPCRPQQSPAETPSITQTKTPPVAKPTPNRRVASPLNDFGFLPVLIQFDPNRYYQTHPRVAGIYDSSYVPFQLQGVQTTATQNLGDFLQTRQIPFVFVNLPLSDDYLDAARLNYEQRFIRHMRQLSGEAFFLFRDLLQRWPAQNQYFMDPSHLNQFGAQAVANELAADPAMPWPQ